MDLPGEGGDDGGDGGGDGGGGEDGGDTQPVKNFFFDRVTCCNNLPFFIIIRTYYIHCNMLFLPHDHIDQVAM